MDSLRLDLYQPTDDDLDKWAVVVVVHKGTFLPKGLFVSTGARDNLINVQTCERLAELNVHTSTIQVEAV